MTGALRVGVEWLSVFCTLLSLLIISVIKAERGEGTQHLWEMTNSQPHYQGLGFVKRLEG